MQPPRGGSEAPPQVIHGCGAPVWLWPLAAFSRLGARVIHLGIASSG
jgi:hypothetical protein